MNIYDVMIEIERKKVWINQQAQPGGPRNGKGKGNHSRNGPPTSNSEITTVVSQITSSANDLLNISKETTRQISCLKTLTDYNFDESTLFIG